MRQQHIKECKLHEEGQREHLKQWQLPNKVVGAGGFRDKDTFDIRLQNGGSSTVYRTYQRVDDSG